MSNVAERLGPLSVLDADGAVTALGTLWQTRPIVLAFVRHFG